MDHVVAVGVTGTSGTLVALDAGHRPVLPAIMYNDARSRRQAERVQDAGADLSARLGYRFGSSFGLPKILWLKEQHPDAYGRAALFVSPTDFIIGHLTGEWGRSDQTNMLKFGYDLLEDRWPAFIADAPRHRPGPAAARADLRLARRPGDARRRRPHRPARRGARGGRHDGRLRLAGQQRRGRARASGTPRSAPRWSSRASAASWCSIPSAASTATATRPAGGCPAAPPTPAASAWRASSATRRRPPAARPERPALDHAPTSLVAYPLARRGERFPFSAPDAEGFLIGEPRDRDELFVAYLEGVACLERLAYETLDELGAEVEGGIFSAGGGSRSDAWLQIRADVLGRPVLRPEQTGAATGAAILAAALEHYDGLGPAARAMVRIGKQVEPRPQMTAAYAEKYARFREECMTRGYLERPWPGKA